MKKIITLLLLVSVSVANAQAFTGKGDKKINVGATFQEDGTGIEASIDFGLGENFSFGFGTSYVLGINNSSTYSNDFNDRIDARLRLNANLGSVFGLNPKMDVYPGLDISTKNFGGHVGFRYFFTDGFGLFTEGVFPIAKYDTESGGFNNQFTLNLGASFNL